MTLIQTLFPNHITLQKQGACSAEVRALAPVFEKSSTEFKPEPKQLRCKNIVNIETFNDRTLNTVNQLPELTASADEHNIDTICIQEHRYYHSEQEIKYHDAGKGWTFASASAWKNSIKPL